MYHRHHCDLVVSSSFLPEGTGKVITPELGTCRCLRVARNDAERKNKVCVCRGEGMGDRLWSWEQKGLLVPTFAFPFFQSLMNNPSHASLQAPRIWTPGHSLLTHRCINLPGSPIPSSTQGCHGNGLFWQDLRTSALQQIGKECQPWL